MEVQDERTKVPVMTSRSQADSPPMSYLIVLSSALAMKHVKYYVLVVGSCWHMEETYLALTLKMLKVENEMKATLWGTQTLR